MHLFHALRRSPRQVEIRNLWKFVYFSRNQPQPQPALAATPADPQLPTALPRDPGGAGAGPFPLHHESLPSTRAYAMPAESHETGLEEGTRGAGAAAAAAAEDEAPQSEEPGGSELQPQARQVTLHTVAHAGTGAVEPATQDGGESSRGQGGNSEKNGASNGNGASTTRAEKQRLGPLPPLMIAGATPLDLAVKPAVLAMGSAFALYRPAASPGPPAPPPVLPSAAAGLPPGVIPSSPILLVHDSPTGLHPMHAPMLVQQQQPSLQLSLQPGIPQLDLGALDRRAAEGRMFPGALLDASMGGGGVGLPNTSDRGALQLGEMEDSSD